MRLTVDVIRWNTHRKLIKAFLHLADWLQTAFRVPSVAVAIQNIYCTMVYRFIIFDDKKYAI